MAQTPGIRANKLNQHSPLNIRGMVTSMYVTVDTATRDGGPNGAANVGAASAKLEPGLLLNKGTDEYTNLTTTSSEIDNPEDIVILLDYVDVTNGDQMAHVAFGGGAIFDRNQIRYTLAADKTNIDFEQVTIPTVKG